MLYSHTRRTFLKAAGLTLAAHGAGATAAGTTQRHPTHAYVAVGERIEVLRSAHGVWRSIQAIDSHSPSDVVTNTACTLLFVANARTQFEGLPTASVESYRIDPHSGLLTFIERRKLSLAAVMPHAIALSPNESLLVVSAAGGIYNMLPVSHQGAIGEVAAVRKELVTGDGSYAHMRFVSDECLYIHDGRGCRLYTCNCDDMQLIAPAAPYAVPPQNALLLLHQRSVAFATLR